MNFLKNNLRLKKKYYYNKNEREEVQTTYLTQIPKQKGQNCNKSELVLPLRCCHQKTLEVARKRTPGVEIEST